MEDALRVCLVFVAALSFRILETRNNYQVVFRLLLWGMASALAAYFAVKVWTLVSVGPQQWDFLAFYFDASVAASGKSPYDPASYYDVETRLAPTLGKLGIQLDDAFQAEVFDPAFKNPPFTLFFHFPLVVLPLETSNAVWRTSVYLSVLVFCWLLSVVAMRASAGGLPKRSLGYADAFALCIVVAFCSRGVSALLGFAQSGAFVGIGILLILASNATYLRIGGLVLAILAKPFGAIALPFLFFVREFRVLASALAAVGALVLASFIVFGPAAWEGYLSGDFAKKLPAWMFYQDNSTSLLSEMLRWHGVSDRPTAVPVLFAAYKLIAGIVIVVAAGVCLLAGRVNPPISMALLLSTCLLVYPGTQQHYGVLGLIPLLLIATDEVSQSRGKFGLVLILPVAVGVLNAVPAIGYACLSLGAAGLLIHDLRVRAKH